MIVYICYEKLFFWWVATCYRDHWEKEHLRNLESWFLTLKSTFLKILYHSKKVHASSQVIIIFWDVFEACSFYVIFMPLNSHVSVRTLHCVLRWPEFWSFERKTYAHIILFIKIYINTFRFCLKIEIPQLGWEPSLFSWTRLWKCPFELIKTCLT